MSCGEVWPGELWQSRSSEQSASPFPSRSTLFTMSHPDLARPFPPSPSLLPLLDFFRYHRYAHLFREQSWSIPFWMLSVHLSGCAHLSLLPAVCLCEWSPATRPQQLWNVIFLSMHEAGQRVWLCDDANGEEDENRGTASPLTMIMSPTSLMTLPVVDLSLDRHESVICFFHLTASTYRGSSDMTVWHRHCAMKSLAFSLL